MKIDQELLQQTAKAFKWIYKNLDGLSIKEKVDKHGIEGYINRCAGLAATSGGIAGFGGGITFAVALPADVINNIIQQFKVTLAVIYHKTGKYNVSFTEFMKIVGVSVGVEAGAGGMKLFSLKIAEQIIKRLSGATAAKLIPILGGLIGAGVGFGFIKLIGNSLVALEKHIFNNH